MTIFVDMDEVMADAYQAHIDIYNKEHQTAITLSECDGKEFWQVVPEAHQKSVKGHAHRIGFFRDLAIIDDCQEVMEALCAKHEVFVASAAMQFPYSLKEKSDWLDDFFPFIHWRNRILCGHKYILKGDVLIDDRSYNLENFEGDTLLFSSPHNSQTKGFDRVSNWKEVASKLL